MKGKHEVITCCDKHNTHFPKYRDVKKCPNCKKHWTDCID